MKNISKYLILSAIVVTFINCSNQTERKCWTGSNNCELDSIFQIVQFKLKSDSISFEICGTLFSKYLMDIDSRDTFLNNFYDLYLSLYNKGNPFVRLIDENKLIIIFYSIASNKNHQKILWSDYYNIINNRGNYKSDKDIGGENSQLSNFYEYIKKNRILPDSH